MTPIPQLQDAYLKALREVGSEWTDETLAEAAYTFLYGGSVDDLMQAWRFQRSLRDPADPEHAKAWDVHEAVQRFKARQEQAGV